LLFEIFNAFHCLEVVDKTHNYLRQLVLRELLLLDQPVKLLGQSQREGSDTDMHVLVDGPSDIVEIDVDFVVDW